MVQLAKWDFERFRAETERLATLTEASALLHRIHEFFPFRRALLRLWRDWPQQPDVTAQLASYPLTPTNDGASPEALRRARIDQLAFHRIMPINLLEEVRKQTELGQFLGLQLREGTAATTACGVAIIVRGPINDRSLFVADSDMDSAKWTHDFEAFAGALQIAIQRLHLAITAILEPPAAVLTRREQECLEACAKGLTAKQTAKQLNISDQTVTFYLGRIRMKLGVANTTEAVALAVKRGLISV